MRHEARTPLTREGEPLLALAPLPGHSRLGGVSQDAVDDLGVFCPE